MEGGQFKIGAIIQARLGSTRLPNKVMLPFPIGSQETVISQVIKSIKGISEVSEVIVATSSSSVNNRLESYISSLGVRCFRGSEQDVLSRFYNIVKRHKFKYIIRFTGDNPIVDAKLLKKFIDNFISKKLDYSNSDNLPLGCNFEMMKASEIIKAFQNTNSQFDIEHVTPYIKRNALKTENFVFHDVKSMNRLRLTIDYPSDYAFVNMIYMMLKGQKVSVNHIVNLINNNSWLLDINKNNFQKKEFNNIDEEIENILPVIEERELNRLKKELKQL